MGGYRVYEAQAALHDKSADISTDDPIDVHRVHRNDVDRPYVTETTVGHLRLIEFAHTLPADIHEG